MKTSTKKKRLKTVFSYAELSHVWAAQSQEHGRANGHRMFFNGDSIYSYGTHFKIARRLDAKTVLFYSGSYSPTTTKHQWAVRGAITHLDSFEVPNIETAKSEKNYEYLSNKASDALSEFFTARNLDDWNIERVTEKIEEYNRFTKRFGTIKGFPKKLELDTDTRNLLQDLIKKSQARIAELKAIKDARTPDDIKQSVLKREIERNRKEAIANFKLQQLRWDWKAGKVNDTEGFTYGEVFLRIKDNNLETSRGARVPLDKALELYRALSSGVRILKRTKIGPYEFTKATKNEIVIGCHTIEMSEAERVLGALA